MHQRKRSPPVSLPHCSMQTFPVSETLLYRMLPNNIGLGTYLHAFELCTENDPQAFAATLLDGLLKSCSSLSSNACLLVGILAKCLLLAPIARPANTLDSRCASRAFLFYVKFAKC